MGGRRTTSVASAYSVLRFAVFFAISVLAVEGNSKRSSGAAGKRVVQLPPHRAVDDWAVLAARRLSAASPTCVYENGKAPDAGLCSGPIDRALARFLASNHTCGPEQVLYYRDGDPADPKCGDCVPGSSGVEDNLRVCKLDEYCDDAAVCKNIKHSPLYRAKCPWEQGGPTSEGWCGPGLRCIHHRCAQCESGVKDPRDGKVCVSGKWTYSRWALMFYRPADVWTFLIFVFLILWFVFDMGLKFRKFVFKRRLRKLHLKRRRPQFANFGRRVMSELSKTGKAGGGGGTTKLLEEEPLDDAARGEQQQQEELEEMESWKTGTTESSRHSGSAGWLGEEEKVEIRSSTSSAGGSGAEQGLR